MLDSCDKISNTNIISGYRFGSQKWSTFWSGKEQAPHRPCLAGKNSLPRTNICQQYLVRLGHYIIQSILVKPTFVLSSKLASECLLHNLCSCLIDNPFSGASVTKKNRLTTTCNLMAVPLVNWVLIWVFNISFVPGLVKQNKFTRCLKEKCVSVISKLLVERESNKHPSMIQ